MRQPSSTKVWDVHAIKAEIHRRGQTLASLAQAAGYRPATMRWALKRPIPGANRAIAQFLGLSIQELWPSWYDADGKLIPTVRPNSNRKSEARESVNAA